MYPGECEDKFICVKCGCGRGPKNRIFCWCEVVINPNHDTITADRLEYNPEASFTWVSCPECKAEPDGFHKVSCSKREGHERWYMFHETYKYDPVYDSDLVASENPSEVPLCACGAKNGYPHKSVAKMITTASGTQLTSTDRYYCTRKPVRNRTRLDGPKPSCLCGVNASELHKEGCQEEFCPFSPYDGRQHSLGKCDCVGEKVIKGSLITIRPEKRFERLRCHERCSVCNAYKGSSHRPGCTAELCPIHPETSLASCGCKVVRYTYPIQSPVEHKETGIFRPTYRPFRGSAGRNPGRKLK